MTVIVGSDKKGENLKKIILEFLSESGHDYLDVSEEKDMDFVDVTLLVASEVNKSSENLGIVIDSFGVGPFMVATKLKGMVCAVVSDERSAYMTRGHNNSRMVTIGAEICGSTLAKKIVKGFVEGNYDGGRHQIRVDMLNKMC